MVAVYRVTDDHDLVAIGKYERIEATNEYLQAFVASPEIERASVEVVFEAISEFEPPTIEPTGSLRG